MALSNTYSLTLSSVAFGPDVQEWKCNYNENEAAMWYELMKVSGSVGFIPWGNQNLTLYDTIGNSLINHLYWTTNMG